MNFFLEKRLARLTKINIKWKSAETQAWEKNLKTVEKSIIRTKIEKYYTNTSNLGKNLNQISEKAFARRLIKNMNKITSTKFQIESTKKKLDKTITKSKKLNKKLDKKIYTPFTFLLSFIGKNEIACTRNDLGKSIAKAEKYVNDLKRLKNSL